MSSPDGHSLLSFLERPATAGTPEPWLLVLMHGVGSNEQDLFGLAPHVPGHFHVVSLRAPYVLAPGAFAWFEFHVRPDGSRQINAAQEAASRVQVAGNVAAHARRLGIAAARVVVGGFSQGGIMSLSLLRTRPELLHGALVLHSRLLPEVEADAVPPAALAGKHLWVSHGLQDTVIPLASAHATRERMAESPVALTYAEFPGGHEIRPAELAAAMGWLAALRAPVEPDQRSPALQP